jgi:hypothetical protein
MACLYELHVSESFRKNQMFMSGMQVCVYCI